MKEKVSLLMKNNSVILLMFVPLKVINQIIIMSVFVSSKNTNVVICF